MEHRAARVLALELLLQLQRLEGVVGKADRQLGGVGIVGRFCGTGLEDAGEPLAILAGEAVGGPFGRGCLQVVHMAGLLLEEQQPFSDVVQAAAGQGPPLVRGDVMAVVGEVADHLVDAVHAHRGEVVAQGAQVSPRVRKQAAVHVASDLLALDLQAGSRQLQQPVQAAEQGGLVPPVLISEPGAVDRHHADGAGLLGRAEQSVAALQQLPQVQLQAAAHGADHVGGKLRVEKVLEVGEPVAGGHCEQQLGVFALPGEVGGDVVGGDGEGEDPPLVVPGGHDLDIGPVDHVHLGLELSVAERHLLAADHRDLGAQVRGADPVEGQVGEGRLGAPSRGNVQVEHQFLDVLPHLFI